MRTLIYVTAIRIILPMFLLFSLYLFFRGHDHPGGGFIAALVASVGFIFHMLAFGIETTKVTYNVNTFALMGSGLAAALLSALIPVWVGKNFMEALWLPIELPVIGKLGTPILFDLGVYLLVVGMVLKTAFSLFED